MSDLIEVVKGQDTGTRKAMAAERKAGDKKKTVKAGESYATFQKQRIKWADQTSKAKKHIHGSIDEVAPPGWGHTKAEKEKTKPDKPKSKIGGSAAAFKRALDDGRFKGLPGDKTKKEKTARMFKLMWSMKKKGDKPHYKPGTDKKYKKYQEEGVGRAALLGAAGAVVGGPVGAAAGAAWGASMGKKKVTGDVKKKKPVDIADPHGNVAKSKKKKKSLQELNRKETRLLNKASVGMMSDDPKAQDKARKRQAEADFRDLMRQRKAGKVGVGKSMKESKSWKSWKTAAKAALGKKTPKHDYGKDAGAEAAKRLRKKDHEKVNFLNPDD